MSTTFCPNCGAEYLAGVTECADCHVPLGEPRADALEEAERAQRFVGDLPEEADEVVYELGDWSQDERRQLGFILSSQGIAHRWEVGTDLVVREADSGKAEVLMDEVESGTGLPALDAAADDAGDDAVTYSVMSDLYVAADRLQHSPADVALAGEFYMASDAAAVTAPPFGIDVPVWRQVQELASSIAAALEADADDDVIARDAGSLRQLLSRYV